jgi:hypothetical protein
VKADARQMQVRGRNSPDHGRMPKAVLRVVGGIDDPWAALRRASSNHCSANLSNISRFFGSLGLPSGLRTVLRKPLKQCSQRHHSLHSTLASARRYLIPLTQLACHLTNARTSATSPALKQVYGPARSLQVKHLRLLKAAGGGAGKFYAF